MSSNKQFEILKSDTKTKLKLTLYISPVSAGFPSPADDFIDCSLDLNEYLITHPAATFFVRVKGDSMTGAGIHCSDILIRVMRILTQFTPNMEIYSIDEAFLLLNGLHLSNLTDYA